VEYPAAASISGVGDTALMHRSVMPLT
jgi:hypothetical protein